MNIGLVTVASGNIQYYKLAYNLLLSYKFFSKNPYPFYIICEKENKYTKRFDKTIVVDTKSITHSTFDKLLVLNNLLFDETLFVEPDSLAYGDINIFFNLFRQTNSFFSAIGVNLELHDQNARFDIKYLNKDEIGSIQHKCRINGTFYYIKKNGTIPLFYKKCHEIYSNYQKYHFKLFPNHPEDETILDLTMSLFHQKALVDKPRIMCALPSCTNVTANISKQTLLFRNKLDDCVTKGVLLHFGTKQTYSLLYKKESSYILSRYKRWYLFIYAFYRIKWYYMVFKKKIANFIHTNYQK